jgi:hypothetical protein
MVSRPRGHPVPAGPPNPRGQHDLQRALDAGGPGTNLPVTGIFDTGTDVALRRWQPVVPTPSSEVADAGTWKLLATGVRSAS